MVPLTKRCCCRVGVTCDVWSLPGSFAAYHSCVWIVTASSGYSVNVYFPSASLSGSNSITVRDGSYSTAPLLGTLTGSSTSRSYTSSSVSIYVEFDVDANGDGATFSASFSCKPLPLMAWCRSVCVPANVELSLPCLVSPLRPFGVERQQRTRRRHPVPVRAPARPTSRPGTASP